MVHALARRRLAAALVSMLVLGGALAVIAVGCSQRQPNYDEVKAVPAPKEKGLLEGWVYATGASLGGPGGSAPQDERTVSVAWGRPDTPNGTSFLIDDATTLALDGQREITGSASRVTRALARATEEGLRVEIRYDTTAVTSMPDTGVQSVAVSIREKDSGW